MVLNFLAPLEACSSQVPITSEASKSFIFLSPAEVSVGGAPSRPEAAPALTVPGW